MNNMNEGGNIEWLLVLQILSGSALVYDTDDYLSLTFLMCCQFVVGPCCILAKCNAQWWWWWWWWWWCQWWWQQKQLVIKGTCFH